MSETRPTNSAAEQPAGDETESAAINESTAEQDDTARQEADGSAGAATRRRDSLRKEIRAGWQRALGH